MMWKCIGAARLHLFEFRWTTGNYIRQPPHHAKKKQLQQTNKQTIKQQYRKKKSICESSRNNGGSSDKLKKKTHQATTTNAKTLKCSIEHSSTERDFYRNARANSLFNGFRRQQRMNEKKKESTNKHIHCRMSFVHWVYLLNGRPCAFSKASKQQRFFFSVLLRMTMRLRLKNIEVRKKHRHKQHHTF